MQAAEKPLGRGWWSCEKKFTIRCLKKATLLPRLLPLTAATAALSKFYFSREK
jgi:hypothetical protein